MLAAKNKAVEALRVLLAYGANPGIKCHSGQTALDLAGDSIFVKNNLLKAMQLRSILALKPKDQQASYWDLHGNRLFPTDLNEVVV